MTGALQKSLPLALLGVTVFSITVWGTATRRAHAISCSETYERYELQLRSISSQAGEQSEAARDAVAIWPMRSELRLAGNPPAGGEPANELIMTPLDDLPGVGLRLARGVDESAD